MRAHTRLRLGLGSPTSGNQAPAAKTARNYYYVPTHSGGSHRPRPQRLHVAALGEDLERDQQKRAASRMRSITFYELANFIGLPRIGVLE
jgi:hypothetical protein